MKRALRISCILLLTVLILLANTVFSVAEPADEAVDLSEVLTVLDQKHADYIGRLTDKVYNSCVSYAAGETVGVYNFDKIPVKKGQKVLLIVPAIK